MRGEVHATVRKVMVDWLLSEDHPPDIKIYVTGHSMGGALGTHCAMDLQVRGHSVRRAIVSVFLILYSINSAMFFGKYLNNQVKFVAYV